jgi:3-phosphoshikimate 1-carboxyvinyltransferase
MRMPGDRLSSHLALILGAMARGETIIDGLGESADTFSTGRAMQALGARIDKRAGRWHIMGIGVGGFLEPEDQLHYGSSTMGLQLGMGLLGPYGFTSHFVGDAALSGRPQDRLIEALGGFGVSVLEGDGKLPLSLRGPKLPTPADYRADLPLATIKAAILLGALTIPGTSIVTEPLQTRDQAEKMLRAFGAKIEGRLGPEGARVVEIDGMPNLRAQQVMVAGDPSAAAHAIVAGLIVPNSEILIERVLINPTRLGLIATLQEMGGNIELVQSRRAGGEDVADIRVIHSPLHGVEVPPERIPLLIEEFPLLAVAAAFAEGDTFIDGLAALRLADCDQVQAVARGLAANRVAVQEGPDSLLIHGRGQVQGGGRVATYLDAGIAMAFLVMGMAADGQVTVDDQSAIAQICPGFVQDFENLGASFLRYT